VGEMSNNGARSPLDQAMVFGRHGRPGGQAGITARELRGRAIASIAARRGQLAALTAKIKTRTGVGLPTGPRIEQAEHLSFVWSGVDQWMALAEGEGQAAGGAVFAHELAHDLEGLASVIDQSDARVTISLTGPDVRSMLAKGCMIDLHGDVFKVSDTALTAIALVNVQITRCADVDGDPVFELMVMRSFAASLWHWAEASAAEFGLQVA
jgi:methylglutamate dehydrogenase subunit D